MGALNSNSNWFLNSVMSRGCSRSRCGFAGFAGCELRIALKGVVFLISIATDINYYQIIIEGLIIRGLIIMTIKGFGGINIIMIKGFGGVITLIKTSLKPY